MKRKRKIEAFCLAGWLGFAQSGQCFWTLQAQKQIDSTESEETETETMPDSDQESEKQDPISIPEDMHHLLIQDWSQCANVHDLKAALLQLSQLDAEMSDPQIQEVISSIEAQLKKLEMKPLYRLYNPKSSEHLYTLNQEEARLLALGIWEDEGIAWMSSSQLDQPVYRVYNPNSGIHHYTMNAAEVKWLVSLGWNDEGVGFYSDPFQGLPVYRLYNPNSKDGLHHYTLNEQEAQMLIGLGWKDEGIAFYARKPWSECTEQFEGQSITVYYDENDQAFSGLCTLLNRTCYFNPLRGNALETGWFEILDDSGNSRKMAADEQGNVYFGLKEIDGNQYWFDEQTGIMATNCLMEAKNGLGYWYFDEQGKMVLDCLYIDGTYYAANDEQTALVVMTFGWKENPNLHLMLQTKQGLLQLQQQWQQQGTWDPVHGDLEMKICAAQLQELDTVIPLLDSMETYTVYNPNSGEHFYTTNEAERKRLVSLGWTDEGLAWFSARQGNPVYRVYNPNSGDHHYTTNVQEKNNLVALGWKDEGIAFYSSQLQAKPIYRLYNPNAKAGAHHYTASAAERDNLVKIGWKDEGIGWYGLDGWFFATETIDGQEGTVVYDRFDQKLTGRVEMLRGEQRYFDLETGFLQSGWIEIPDENGEMIEVCLDSEGRFVFGEVSKDGEVYYFQRPNGAMVRNQWVTYSNKKCWYDANGHRASGRMSIEGKTYYFNESTGALQPDLQDLMNQCAAIINARQLPQEQYSMAIRIPDRDLCVLLNNKSQQSASVMKLFVMGAIYENYETYCARYGQSWIDGNLVPMITVSSNDAWVNLVPVLGGGNYATGLTVLRNWNNSKGYTQTWMAGVAYGNYTSARDASQILEDIEEGRLKHAAQMKDLIKRQAVAGRLLQGLPAGTVTGNKPGWVYNAENDTVIVYAPFGTYIITLLADNLTSTLNAQSIMAQISPLVYAWMQEHLNDGKV